MLLQSGKGFSGKRAEVVKLLIVDWKMTERPSPKRIHIRPETRTAECLCKPWGCKPRAVLTRKIWISITNFALFWNLDGGGSCVNGPERLFSACGIQSADESMLKSALSSSSRGRRPCKMPWRQQTFEAGNMRCCPRTFLQAL